MLMEKLKHSKIMHRVMSLLKIQEIATIILSKLGIQKRLPRGTVYRLKCLESYSLEKEIFYSDTYDLLFKNIKVKTFMDLGCNVGYVSCLLKEKCGEDIEGILLDADPKMVAEAEWHVMKNNLKNCHVHWGMVGGESLGGQQNFYISKYNIASSALPYDKNYPLPIGKESKKIKVPVLDAQKIWNDTFKNKRINFLKIDIEGSEINFIDDNSSFFEMVDSIIIEWHKWCVDFESLNQKIQDLNFDLIKIVKEDTVCGLAFYQKNVSG